MNGKQVVDTVVGGLLLLLREGLKSLFYKINIKNQLTHSIIVLIKSKQNIIVDFILFLIKN